LDERTQIGRVNQKFLSDFDVRDLFVPEKPTHSPHCARECASGSANVEQHWFGQHQAAGAGHDELVRLLVERGALLDLKDILWRATPADWARHAGRTEIEAYLRGKIEDEQQE